MTTFAVQKLYSPLEWNVSGTRRLKGSKFSESEKSMYVQHLCYVGKKKYYNLFYRTYDFIPHKIFAAVSFKKRKKVTYLGFSVFLFALVFLFLLMSSENEVLRCLSKCDKTAITLRSMVENFAYDGASFKKEIFFSDMSMWRPMAWSHGTRIQTHHDQIKRNLTHHWQNMQ